MTKKPRVFGCDITLNCFQCGRELPMNDPWQDKRHESIAEKVIDHMRLAYQRHQAANECRPEESTT